MIQDGVQILYMIQNYTVLQSMQFTDSAISAGLHIIQNYQGFCPNQTTISTVAGLMCLGWSATETLRNTTASYLYPSTIPASTTNFTWGNGAIASWIQTRYQLRINISRSFNFTQLMSINHWSVQGFSSSVQASWSDMKLLSGAMYRFATAPRTALISRFNDVKTLTYSRVERFFNILFSHQVRKVFSEFADGVQDYFNTRIHLNHDWAEHNRRMTWTQVVNGTIRQQVRVIFSDFYTQDFRLSPLYALHRKSRSQQSQWNNGMYRWNNYADPMRNLSLLYYMDLYNGAGSFFFWSSAWFIKLFGPSSFYDYMNNRWNASGCIGYGFPWWPETSEICEPPILISPDETQLYPTGFDEWNPQCPTDPITYVKISTYTTSHLSHLDDFIDQNPGWKWLPPFSFMIYNVATTNHTLEPNMIPCTFWAPLQWFYIFAITLGTIYVITTALKIWSKILERCRIFKISKDKKKMPTKKVHAIAPYIHLPSAPQISLQSLNLGRSERSKVNFKIPKVK